MVSMLIRRFPCPGCGEMVTQTFVDGGTDDSPYCSIACLKEDQPDVLGKDLPDPVQVDEPG